jgi:hypothetical protein
MGKRSPHEATAEESRPNFLGCACRLSIQTAINNHMIGEEPRAFFIHSWANDDAVNLAKGLRAALDAVHVAAKG